MVINMNKKMIITSPISFDSVATAGSGSYAYMLSLFQGSNKNINNYICNGYINCYFHTTYFDIYEQDYNFIDKKIFNVNRYKIFLYQLLNDFDSVVQYMFDKFSQGYCMNTKIKINLGNIIEQSFENDEYESNCIVYRIDLDHSMFGLMSLYNEKVVTFSLTFQEFINAVYKKECDEISLEFIAVNPNYVNLIDIDNIIADFNDYIVSTSRKSYFHNDRVYGVDSTIAMMKYINTLCEKMCEGDDIKLPVYNLKCFDDHKKLMNIRLDTLEKEKVITPEHWQKKYVAVSDNSRYLIEKSIQFNSYPSVIIKNEIIDIFNRIYYSENEIISDLCDGGFDV